MAKVRRRWNCTVCGNWMYQNTAEGDPPNEWAIGQRPAD
jgi:rubredoxin